MMVGAQRGELKSNALPACFLWVKVLDTMHNTHTGPPLVSISATEEDRSRNWLTA